MERAARIARIGDRVLSAIAAIMILLLFLYGGYSLWDSYMINKGAFLGGDLLKYKPASTDGGANYTLEELLKLNPDTRGWLTVDDTHIDYPVVQGETDMDYINTSIFGEFELSGSIFLSCLNSPDFSDRYNLVYGHHMDNGGMFGDVLEFVDAEYFEKHQTGTLFLPDRTYGITIFACMEADAYDRLIYSPGPEYELQELLDYLKTSSTQYREIGVSGEDKIIGMSTCKDAATNGRVILFGRLDLKEQP
ncbi:MAG: class B sortase [Lachnospiraceae bacterium]|nr:class B sortase [Lachnospiraceae bacterium]